MLPAINMQVNYTCKYMWPFLSRPAKRENHGISLETAVELSSVLWNTLAKKYPLPLLTEKQVHARGFRSCSL